MDTSPNEVVIAVMGVTGCGKSTFIRTVTRNSSVVVAHGLQSGTSEVQSYRLYHKAKRYVLVDTPGFNDHTDSDETIMTRVLEWMEKSFRSGTRLNGLIYIHRIIDPKMQGSALSNMRMFRQLCGSQCFPNIVLATTFWDDVSWQDGARRERELQTNDEFWGKMVSKGSRIVRLGRTREACLKVMEMFNEKPKVTLQSQDEMVNENKPAKDTSTYQAVNLDLEKQRKEFEEKLRQEKILADIRIANQQRARAAQLAREQRAQKAKETEAKRKREEERLAEERRWMEEYEERQRLLRLEREQQENSRRAKERAERAKKAAEERQAAELKRQADERQEYYRNYTCQRNRDFKYVGCDKCGDTIRIGTYYHCCFCLGDNYDHCEKHGRCCPVLEHPLMTQRYQRYHSDSSCLVVM